MMVQPAPYRSTVEEYERMGATGVFGPSDRLELIDGESVTMAPIGARHAACVDGLTCLFSRLVGDVPWSASRTRSAWVSAPSHGPT